MAVLWTCAIGERVILGRANAGAAQVMRDMRELQFKNRRQPAATPAPTPRRRKRIDVG